MSYSPHHKNGEWLAICNVCGFQFHSSMLKKRWDGLMVCKDDWEERHPQDFVKGVKDDQSVPWTRTEPEDVTIDTSGWVIPDSVPNGTFNNS